MLLAVDVGNTQTHIGMFRGEELVEHFRLGTLRTASADELAIELASLLDLRDLRLRDVDAAIVSSVVPALTQEYNAVSERYLAGALTVVGPWLKTGMPIRIDNPRELGTDRLVNAVAAYDRFRGACVAVDFGTSTNFDVVSSAGEYLGGVIAPGVEISMEALFERAAKLTKVELEAPPSVIGRNTQTAIKSGAVYGFAGQVDGVTERLREELGEELTTIATGGLARAITPYCESIDEVDDDLTLTGLRLIWERNRGA